MTERKRGALLEIDGAAKHFGDKKVLKGIDIVIPPGQFVAIVGRSGCGKSTLLRLAAGLERPTEGALRMNGDVVNGIREETTMMFQDARLLPWKRSIDNVAIVTEGEDKAKALEALHQVGLADKANEWPGVLSGGQRQRVALARSLVRVPSLLLLDEPLGALDALTRLDMQGLIEDIWQQERFTAILVTHDVAEAVALADRVILIEDGTVALDIPITLDRPRARNNDFVYFESLILERILERGASERKTAPSYSI